MADRDAFVEKLEAQLREWTKTLDRLRRKAGKVAAEGRAETAKQIDSLQAQAEAVRKKLHEAREAGEHAWEGLREGVEKAWEEVGVAFDAATTHLRGGSVRRPRPVRVSDVMTAAPAVCRLHDPLREAARWLWERDCGILPVVDGGAHVVGVITDRDICMAAYFENRPLTEITVANVMATDVATCRPDDSLADAMTRMRARQVRRLPVTDASGRLVGLLALNDLVRAAARGNDLPEGELVLRTLAAIGEPRAEGPSTAATRGR